MEGGVEHSSMPSDTLRGISDIIHEHTETIHRDKHGETGFFLVAAILFAPLALVAPRYIPAWLGLTGAIPYMCGGGAALMIFCALLSIRPFHIRVRGDSLCYGYRPFLQRVTVSRIEWIALREIRRLPSAFLYLASVPSTTYAPREGLGVAFHIQGAAGGVTISTDHPEALAQALGKHLAPAQLSPSDPGLAQRPLPSYFAYDELVRPGWKQKMLVAAMTAPALMDVVNRVTGGHSRSWPMIVMSLCALSGVVTHYRSSTSRVRIGDGMIIMGLGDLPRSQKRYLVERIQCVWLDSTMRIRRPGDGLAAMRSGFGVRIRFTDGSVVPVRTNNPDALAHALGQPLLTEPPT